MSDAPPPRDDDTNIVETHQKVTTTSHISNDTYSVVNKDILATNKSNQRKDAMVLGPERSADLMPIFKDENGSYHVDHILVHLRSEST